MKPITYILEACDTSAKHQAVVRFVAATPFQSVAVGERFDDTGWERLDGERAGSLQSPRQYVVHSVKHLLTENESGITCRYQLNLIPFFGPKSPVWLEG